MGKHKFDRKKAVRFSLVPGPEKDGKPTVLYKPVETKKSKLSKKQKKTAISQLADYDQITINGKVVEDDQIPAYVLEQIKGRSDLLFNQMHPEEEEEEVGDLYEVQDGLDEGQYEEYEDYDFEAEGIKEERQKEDLGSEDQWEDDEDYSNQDDIEVNVGDDEDDKPTQLKFKAKVEEFPTLQEVETVIIEGKQYELTKKQLQMLETVIPENYEGMDFGGIKFNRYNEDGLLFSDKEKYQKYLLKENEKAVVVDTYEYVPAKPVDFIDNDLKPSQINGNPNIKEVEEALNYDGEDQIYEELEDDFFSKMIRGELQEKSQESKKKQIMKNDKPQEVKTAKKSEAAKQAPKGRQEPKSSEQELDQKLEKAMFNFEHNIEERPDKKALSEGSDSEEEEQEHSRNNHTTSMNFQDLEKKEEYIGKDGQLDWRFLSKQEKKIYMKTKIIREFYDELREREVEEKLRGKANVTVEQLHLKQRVDHIPFEQDHVMQRVLEEGLKDEGNEEESEEYSSVSEEDDIVSFHQKTSIIATNLSVIEEPQKKKKKAKPEGNQEEASEMNITKIKVVPERRNKNETAEERKERKEKLKEMKKEKRQQKREFAERFSKIKKETMKNQNIHNPLNKVSYVKIY